MSVCFQCTIRFLVTFFFFLFLLFDLLGWVSRPHTSHTVIQTCEFLSRLRRGKKKELPSNLIEVKGHKKSLRVVSTLKIKFLFSYRNFVRTTRETVSYVVFVGELWEDLYQIGFYGDSHDTPRIIVRILV